jgi:subtilisin family serine protease
MRVFAPFCALAAILLAPWTSLTATADAAAAGFDSQHNFVVVTFSNEPYRPASRAGTTGRRYTGESYGVAQSAHEKARKVAAIYSLRQVASWPIKELGVHCVVYEILDARSMSDVLSALAKEPRIALAQPLQEFHTLTTNREASGGTYNDPLYGLQTNLVTLGIAAAHEHSQGAGVRVGLIDTGVDTRHPDLRDRISGTKSFIASNGVNAAAYRHGTAMAGLIAAVANNHVGMVGIAPLARIEVFEACWQLKPDTDDAACNTFTLAQALAAAIEARIPLINLSIAGPADPLLAALVQSGLKRGVIFVGSTAAQTDSFPTNIAGVIGVGDSDREHGNATLSVPGTHVLTLRPDGQYDFESGTSVAAAQLTGIVALLLAVDSHLASGTVVSLLKEPGNAASAATLSGIDVSAALARVEAERAGGRLAKASH